MLYKKNMKNTKLKEVTLGVRVSVEKQKEVLTIAEILDIPYAQILREGLNDKLAELKRIHPELQECETLQING